MLEAYAPDSQRYPLNCLADEYKQTYLDPSFQRRGGMENGSGWSEKQAQFYVGSFLGGLTCNIIVRAHVLECLKWAREQGDKKSEEYFLAKKDEGWEFISIDGHNTSSALYWFIRMNMFMLDPKTKMEKQLKDYNKFEQADILYKEKILVVTLWRISYPQMCHLFRHLNMNESLNKQEHRQAMPTQLSAFIRDIANLGGKQHVLQSI